MRVDNETCIQHVQFCFPLFADSGRSIKDSAWQRLVRNKGVTPASLRESKDYLSHRFERVAAMMELLLEAHADWGLASRKDRVVMETDSFDFNQALQILREHGFRDDEFVLTMEYFRKWGVL